MSQWEHNYSNLGIFVAEYHDTTELECTCAQCSGKQASLALKFSSLPRVLILHLKRFHMDTDGTVKKLMSEIPIPVEMTVSRHCRAGVQELHKLDTRARNRTTEPSGAVKLSSEKKERAGQSLPTVAIGSKGVSWWRKKKRRVVCPVGRYAITSVLSHIGISRTSGHYVTDAYNAEQKRWLTFDDCCISKVDRTSVLDSRESTAYILFYEYRVAGEEEILLYLSSLKDSACSIDNNATATQHGLCNINATSATFAEGVAEDVAYLAQKSN
ncbi:hypothetical protein SKAU_G00386140 [Synaphobranchus kaupii]|uniref:USP domain-containing protein n=1 Tax=Synaphobranchus kaupii TaxID=118154 RepID=A0A9Q1IF65_SYNKA|nr:hypothetical protein SKAU_G00386140 [Synaphobranchus kaupii]